MDKEGHGSYWSQLGALLWVAMNTRPDVAYDVYPIMPHGTKPEKQLVALNKIIRTSKSCEQSLTFSKLVEGDLGKN